MAVITIDTKALRQINRVVRATPAQARVALRQTVRAVAGTARQRLADTVSAGTGVSRRKIIDRIFIVSSPNSAKLIQSAVRFSGKRIPIKEFAHRIINRGHPTRATWLVDNAITSPPEYVASWVNPLGRRQAALTRFVHKGYVLRFATGLTIRRAFDDGVNAQQLSLTQAQLGRRYEGFLRRSLGFKKRS